MGAVGTSLRLISGCATHQGSWTSTVVPLDLSSCVLHHLGEAWTTEPRVRKGEGEGRGLDEKLRRLQQRGFGVFWNCTGDASGAWPRLELHFEARVEGSLLRRFGRCEAPRQLQLSRGSSSVVGLLQRQPGARSVCTLGPVGRACSVLRRAVAFQDGHGFWLGDREASSM